MIIYLRKIDNLRTFANRCETIAWIRPKIG